MIAAPSPQLIQNPAIAHPKELRIFGGFAIKNFGIFGDFPLKNLRKI